MLGSKVGEYKKRDKNPHVGGLNMLSGASFSVSAMLNHGADDTYWYLIRTQSGVIFIKRNQLKYLLARDNAARSILFKQRFFFTVLRYHKVAGKRDHLRVDHHRIAFTKIRFH